MLLKRVVEREWDKGRISAELEREDWREKRVERKRKKTGEAIGGKQSISVVLCTLLTLRK